MNASGKVGMLRLQLHGAGPALESGAVNHHLNAIPEIAKLEDISIVVDNMPVEPEEAPAAPHSERKDREEFVIQDDQPPAPATNRAAPKKGGKGRKNLFANKKKSQPLKKSAAPLKGVLRAIDPDDEIVLLKEPPKSVS